MSSLAELESLVKKLEQAQAEVARAEGKYESAMASLKELGYNSVEMAEEALENLTHQIAQNMAELDKEVQEFEEKYHELFE